MSKRHLSEKQRRRIKNSQQSGQASSYSAQGNTGELRGMVTCHYGTQVDVETLDRSTPKKTHRCHIRANVGSVIPDNIVTGDIVLWLPEEPTGVITAVEGRRSELLRPDKFHRLKPVAANVDQLLIVIAPEPEPHTNLIDRYLIAAHASHIEPVLILNKTDLIPKLPEFIEERGLSIYQKLGYQLLSCSASCGDQLPELIKVLPQKTSVFVGQSGVGKSSLINALLPDIDSTVGPLSESGKGSHTTTTARLYHLDQSDNSIIIDSPGIRDFGLWHLEPNELIHYFIECEPFIGLCKFRDCRHHNEPQCAIQQAVSDGHFSQQRFKSYLRIRSEMEEHQTDKYS